MAVEATIGNRAKVLSLAGIALALSRLYLSGPMKSLIRQAYFTPPACGIGPGGGLGIRATSLHARTTMKACKPERAVRGRRCDLSLSRAASIAPIQREKMARPSNQSTEMVTSIESVGDFANLPSRERLSVAETVPLRWTANCFSTDNPPHSHNEIGCTICQRLTRRFGQRTATNHHRRNRHEIAAIVPRDIQDTPRRH